MSNLNRTKVGEFSIENSIKIDELKENIANIEFMEKYFISLEELFKENTEIELDKRTLELFLNGVKLTKKYENGIYKIYNEKKFIGIGIVKDNLLKRDIVVI